MTLAEHLAALNAEAIAWMAADADRWHGLYSEDMAHWAEMGIHTVEDFERYELVELIWTLYKDVTGTRPRHMDFASMSLEALRSEVKFLDSQMDASFEADMAWDEQIRDWEDEAAARREAELAEQPLPIDYVAARHQDGWI